MAESFELTSFFSGISAEKIYKAWMESDAHSAATGSPASINPAVGGKFSAWDGYILGRNLELEPYRRIMQSWRTTEFPAGSPDSLLEILFEEKEDGTQVTLLHSGIPDGQAGDYRQGWEDYYFKPMKQYFSS